MREYRSVGPNLKSYYYYTNEAATKDDAVATVVIASGMEGTGALFDEIGEYLDTKNYALYVCDELGYGKTGEIVAKTGYKNWKRKESYFAAYNIHGMVDTAKREHPNVPLYLIGNDFGAMLSLFAVKEFPENIDKFVTIGWGMPRAQDWRFLLGAFVRKFFLFDANKSAPAHFKKNLRLSLHFEGGEKYSWLSSDLDQVKKIKEAGYLDTPGTVGHYFYYYARKVRTPNFMRLHGANRDLPMLFISGESDLTTLKGRKTNAMARFYKRRKFKNVESAIVPGRHELFFEKNRFEFVDCLIKWFETGSLGELSNQIIKNEETIPASVNDVEVVGGTTSLKENKLDDAVAAEFKEAEEEDLRIRVKK